MSLPYRYELTLRVTVADDGLHADGDGAMATAFRLAKLVSDDDHVVEIWPLPHDVRYLGKVESFPAPLPAAPDDPEVNPLGVSNDLARGDGLYRLFKQGGES